MAILGTTRWALKFESPWLEHRGCQERAEDTVATTGAPSFLSLCLYNIGD